MKIIPRLRRNNPLDSLSMGDLLRTESMLKYRINTLESDILNIGGQMKERFDTGASLHDESQRLCYAIRIRALVEEYRIKVATCERLERDLRLLSHIISIKVSQRALSRSDALQKIASLSSDDLDEWLGEQAARDEVDRCQVEEIVSITAEHSLKSGTPPVDETAIAATMKEIRKGVISSDLAVNNLMKWQLRGKEAIRTTIMHGDDLSCKRQRDEQ